MRCIFELSGINSAATWTAGTDGNVCYSVAVVNVTRKITRCLGRTYGMPRSLTVKEEIGCN